MKFARIARSRAFGRLEKAAAMDEMNDLHQRADLIVWTLVLVGIFLRVLRYARNRSLWLDEIFLASNLTHKSAVQLLGPLDYRQGAPPLFLLLCKFTITLLGNSEYALRLMPLLAGIGGLCVFAILARRMLSPIGALAAVALFALLEPLIYYSSEVKQYSTDVLVAVTIMWAAIYFAKADQISPRKSWVALFIAGAVGLFLSHPAVFVMAGAACWLLLSVRVKWKLLAPLLIGWLSTWLADYVLFLKPLQANAGLQHHWANAYPPISAAIIPWLWSSCNMVFAGYDTMWLHFTIVGSWPAYAGMVLAAIGAWNVFRRGYLGLIGIPIVLTLLAAALHQYPFDDRLVLFLVPAFVLMMGAGLDGDGSALTALLFFFIVLSCASREFVFALHAPGREEIRPVMRYLADHWRAGDSLYLYPPAEAGFIYYRKQLGLGEIPFIYGQWQSGHPASLQNDWRQLAGRPRVWILFSHVLPTIHGNDETEFLTLAQDEHAIPIEQFGASGASLYLLENEHGPRTGLKPMRGNSDGHDEKKR